MQGSTQPGAARLRSPHLLPGQLSPSSSHSHVMSSTANWANSQGTIALAVHTGNSTPACHHAHLPHVTMLIHLHHLVRERHSHLHAGCRTCPTSCVLVRPSSHRHCCRPVLSPAAPLKRCMPAPRPWLVCPLLPWLHIVCGPMSTARIALGLPCICDCA